MGLLFEPDHRMSEEGETEAKSNASGRFHVSPFLFPRSKNNVVIIQMDWRIHFYD